MTVLKTLDTVALLTDVEEYGLVKGQVGTIVEPLEDNMYEVEFADKQGRTLSTLALKAEDLMLLYFEAVWSR